MRTTVVTGSAGGMGVAIRQYLENKGENVIGVDTHDAELIADLSNPEGRAAMVKGVAGLCDGKLDGVVAAAGVHSILGAPGDLISSVNYFGAIATLEGLRPMLEKSEAPRAVAMGSHSMVIIPVFKKLLEAYTVNDEMAARALSNELELSGGMTDAVYATSKFGLASWVRENAIKPQWIGKGITLNVVAPGMITTRMAPEEHEEMVKKDLADVYPMPTGRAGTPEEIAGLVGYLLSEIAGFMCGAIINMDGGTEAALRRDDSPTPRAFV